MTFSYKKERALMTRNRALLPKNRALFLKNRALFLFLPLQEESPLSSSKLREWFCLW